MPSHLKSKVCYHILWPGGNTTAIVDKYPIGTNLQSVSSLIMDRHKDVEQVGFVARPKSPRARFRLQMMGGEFCGNASRSIAFLMAGGSDFAPVLMEGSGFETVFKAEAAVSSAKIVLPGNFFISAISNDGLGIVDLCGIRHIIVEGERPTEAAALNLVQKYSRNFPAVGVMYISKHDFSLEPYVWVRDMGKIVRETSCGSGSIAAAIFFRAGLDGREEFEIRQPSRASLLVSLESEGSAIRTITLDGPVKYMQKGEIQIGENRERNFYLPPSHAVSSPNSKK